MLRGAQLHASETKGSRRGIRKGADMLISCCLQPGSGSFPPTSPSLRKQRNLRLFPIATERNDCLSGSTQPRALPDPATYQSTDDGKTDHQLCCWALEHCKDVVWLLMKLGAADPAFKVSLWCVSCKGRKSLFLLELVFCGGKLKNPSIISMKKSGSKKPGKVGCGMGLEPVWIPSTSSPLMYRHTLEEK